MALSKGTIGTFPKGKVWSIPLMQNKPKLLKRLEHIAPLTPVNESEFKIPPKKKKKVKTMMLRQTDNPEPRDYEYVHAAPYDDRRPFLDALSPRWERNDVDEVISGYLHQSQFGPTPDALRGPKACACCQDMNRENSKRQPPTHTFGYNFEPLIKDPGFIRRSPHGTLAPLPRPHPYPGLRAQSPELESRSRHIQPIGQAWATPEPIEPSSLDALTLNTTIPGTYSTFDNPVDVFPKHPQRAPRNRTPPQPARTLPALPLTRPGGLLEPDRPLDPTDYRTMHLTKERRSELLAAGGYNARYSEVTERGEVTDEVVDASTRYHRAMEKLGRHINGLRVPNEKTMMEQL